MYICIFHNKYKTNNLRSKTKNRVKLIKKTVKLLSLYIFKKLLLSFFLIQPTTLIR